jgi:hypothetical protein
MTSDVLIRREGAVGRISLDRAKALHALTTAMCEAISAALLEWCEDPSVEAVILDHHQGRGFCAGGDVAMVRRSALEDGGAAGRAFFHAEYRMNHLLFTYRKPVVAFMDGVTMGGGVGLALPCRWRVATGNTVFAMPEGAIGLFPDVGAGWYLPRLPGRIGQFLACGRGWRRTICPLKRSGGRRPRSLPSRDGSRRSSPSSRSRLRPRGLPGTRSGLRGCSPPTGSRTCLPRSRPILPNGRRRN